MHMDFLTKNFTIMFKFYGSIVEGRGNGKSKLGFATANMVIKYNNTDVRERRAAETTGAWVVRAHLPGNAFEVHSKYLPMSSRVKMGFAGVSLKNKELVFEIHILDFDDNLYGKNIAIDLLERIREQITFPNIEAADRKSV